MNLVKIRFAAVFIAVITCVAGPVIFPATGCTQTNQADLIVIGKIITMDSATQQAQAMAIKGQRILAVGSVADVEKFSGSDTRTVRLKPGSVILPGFIEGHAHFMGIGESLLNLQLQEAKSWGTIVKQVEEKSKTVAPGEWILGRGWHQSKWDTAPEKSVEGYPAGESMSKVTPNHPVLLTHASGHMSFANDYAMRLAGIDKNTKDPEGGEILRDESGKPIGIFRETAQQLINKALTRDLARKTEEQTVSRINQVIELASRECVMNGITSFQDAGSSFAAVESLTAAADNGELGVRLWVMIRDRNDRLEAKLPTAKKIGYANDFLTVRAVKRSIDGALGAHGAWLLAPYDDLPNSSGLNTASIESVTKTAEIAIKNDFQVCVHAIGDRANREVLNIYEAMFKQNPTTTPRRWRIEHAQHLHPDDIPRFGKLGVIASMQAVHCTSDAVFVPKRLGMRRSAEGAYVWKSLLETGAIVTNGTDAPVENVNPLASIYASVSRKLSGPDPGSDSVSFFPKQCLTREEALRSYTIDCAYAAFEETQKGSLVAGKFADFVVWDTNLMTCKEEDILKAKPLATFVGGRIKFSQGDDFR